MSESESRPAAGQPGQPGPEPAADTAGPSGSSGPAATRQGGDPLRGSRTSGLWIAMVLFGIILVLLIIFIAQNTDPVSVQFLGWSGQAPLAVALLAATVAGLLLAGVAGSLRILQLRRRVRREKKSSLR